MGKPWVKIYVEEWESGSVRVDMTSEQRGFWLDMILRASHSRKEGFICRDANGMIGFTNKELADNYHVSVELVESTIAKRLSDKSIILHPNNVIELVNYWKYQAKPSKNGVKAELPVDQTKTIWDAEHKENMEKAMVFKGAQKHPKSAKAGIEVAETDKRMKEACHQWK